MITTEISLAELPKQIQDGVGVYLTVDQRRQALNPYVETKKYREGVRGDEDVFVEVAEDGSFTLNWSSATLLQGRSGVVGVTYKYGPDYNFQEAILQSSVRGRHIVFPVRCTGDWLLASLHEFVESKT